MPMATPRTPKPKSPPATRPSTNVFSIASLNGIFPSRMEESMWGFHFPLSSSCSGSSRGLWVTVAALFVVSTAFGGTKTQFSSACRLAENWTFGDDLKQALPQESRETFRRFLVGEIPGTKAYEAAVALKNQEPNEVAGAFADYWIARAYYSMGVAGLAAQS